jgi:hypothetical protein
MMRAAAEPRRNDGESDDTDGPTFRHLVAAEKYVIGQHASERLEERGIMEWQVVAGLDDGILLVERPDAIPNPAVEVCESLPDGTEFKAVWSYLQHSGVAKLVTVHFFDRVYVDANPWESNQEDAAHSNREVCGRS